MAAAVYLLVAGVLLLVLLAKWRGTWGAVADALVQGKS